MSELFGVLLFGNLFWFEVAAFCVFLLIKFGWLDSRIIVCFLTLSRNRAILNYLDSKNVGAQKMGMKKHET